VRSLAAGQARGAITGGCLSVVVASLGTPWEIDTADKILFLEDVNEKPYRIDRMLMQLKLAGKLRCVRGIVFGAMPGCDGERDCGDAETLTAMLQRMLLGMGIPVAIGFPSGHVRAGNLTLPFGVAAALECSASGVRLQVEAAAFKAVQHSLR
jgi:muramoyltetrapeptide carboxypeptidase